MTPYQERREAGEYDAPQDDATEDNATEDNGAPSTVVELKAALEERGLPTYGTKAQMKERLAEADAAPAEAEA